MLSKVMSYGFVGIEGYPVLVETDIYNGLPSYEICGLPDASVRESRDRVRSAIKNSGFEYPTKKITINLAPADQRKEGPIYDVPIAIGLLAASEQISNTLLDDTIIFGELSLNGEIRPIKGLVPMVIDAMKRNYSKIIIPFGNIHEVENISGISIIPVKHLKELTDLLDGKIQPEPLKVIPWESIKTRYNAEVDFAEIHGQEKAKRAMEIAAAGRHSVLLIGSFGTGKTLLARALPGILPDLNFDEALSIMQIYSIADATGDHYYENNVIDKRPFRSPHHTASTVAVIGGGNKCQPGEISLANGGVLFFDELPEFPRSVIETLRQPLEDGRISVSRANMKVTYPAEFMFIASMNPCPCGNFGSDELECRCTPSQIERYLSKISGPLLDRLDLHVEVNRVKYDDLHAKASGETSQQVRKRVNAARVRQLERLKAIGKKCNAQLTTAEIKEYSRIDKEAESLLAVAYEKLKLSVRSYARILNIARTIADLDESESVRADHVAEALQYRSLDKKYWSHNYH